MQATDGNGNRGMKAVKVTVVNAGRARGGNPVEDAAAGRDRGDGEPHRPRREHIRPAPGSGVSLVLPMTGAGAIEDANSDTYTPVGQRRGRC